MALSALLAHTAKRSHATNANKPAPVQSGTKAKDHLFDDVAGQLAGSSPANDGVRGREARPWAKPAPQLSPQDKSALCRAVAVAGIPPERLPMVRKLATAVGQVEKVDESPSEATLKFARLDGRPEGQVVVFHFQSIKAAVAAVPRLHRAVLKDVSGSKGVLWARQVNGEGSYVKRWRLVVRNVPFDCTEQELIDFYSPAGFVWGVTLPRKEGGGSKGFAFVSFTSKSHATLALRTLNAKLLRSRPIIADWALSKDNFVAATKQPDSNGAADGRLDSQERGAPATNSASAAPAEAGLGTDGREARLGSGQAGDGTLEAVGWHDAGIGAGSEQREEGVDARAEEQASDGDDDAGSEEDESDTDWESSSQVDTDEGGQQMDADAGWEWPAGSHVASTTAQTTQRQLLAGAAEVFDGDDAVHGAVTGDGADVGDADADAEFREERAMIARAYSNFMRSLSPSQLAARQRAGKGTLRGRSTTAAADRTVQRAAGSTGEDLEGAAEGVEPKRKREGSNLQPLANGKAAKVEGAAARTKSEQQSRSMAGTEPAAHVHKSTHGGSGNQHTAESGPGAERHAQHLDVQVYVRNVPLDASSQDLAGRLEQFGPIKACRLVMNKSTGQPKGAAFVEFNSAGSAAAACAACAAGRSGTGLGIRVKGKQLAVDMALAQDDVRKLAATKGSESASKDRRNLYLGREGQIAEGSTLWTELSAADQNKRRAAAYEKNQKLKSPNFYVSKTRLHIVNVPRTWEDKQLKKCCLAATCAHASKSKPHIKQCVVLKDRSRTDSEGHAKPRGIAFVEFTQHEDALVCLRHMNNHPSLFGSAQKRPIVEFAIENVKIVKSRERQQRRQEELRQKRALAEPDEDDDNDGGAEEAPAMPERSRQQKQKRGKKRPRRS